jgi:TetR/AcrR family transcriptional repressor of nem operon
VTAHVRAQLDRFSQLLRGGTAASRRERALATLAGIIGALMLARAVEDPSLSEEILSAARDAFWQGAAVEPER